MDGVFSLIIVLLWLIAIALVRNYQQTRNEIRKLKEELEEWKDEDSLKS